MRVNSVKTWQGERAQSRGRSPALKFLENSFQRDLAAGPFFRVTTTSALIAIEISSNPLITNLYIKLIPCAYAKAYASQFTLELDENK